MARLSYSAIASLDGYVSDESGDFTWSAPDEEVHAFVNQLERPIGTYLYGRRMYEVMTAWQTMGTDPTDGAIEVEYREIWRAADKVVYSRTLGPDEVATPRTRVEAAFDPAGVRAWVDGAEQDVSIGGAELAGQALRAGIVDELTLILVPHVVGGGHPALPSGWRAPLELLDHRHFTNGTAYLRYTLA